jgi:hypothetical protein
MAVRNTYTVDPRLPVGEHVSETDPAHPNMVTRNLLIVQNQAVADTKYDVVRPKRVYEPFGSSNTTMTAAWQQYRFYILSALLPAILYGMLNTRQFAIKVVYAFAGIWLLHAITERLEESMRTCLRS